MHLCGYVCVCLCSTGSFLPVIKISLTYVSFSDDGEKVSLDRTWSSGPVPPAPFGHYGNTETQTAYHGQTDGRTDLPCTFRVRLRPRPTGQIGAFRQHFVIRRVISLHLLRSLPLYAARRWWSSRLAGVSSDVVCRNFPNTRGVVVSCPVVVSVAMECLLLLFLFLPFLLFQLARVTPKGNHT